MIGVGLIIDPLYRAKALKDFQNKVFKFGIIAIADRPKAMGKNRVVSQIYHRPDPQSGVYQQCGRAAPGPENRHGNQPGEHHRRGDLPAAPLPLRRQH